MTYKVTVHDPTSPDGQAISMYGLGGFENGVTREITDDDTRIFEELTGYTVEEINNPYVKVEKVKETKSKVKDTKEEKEEEAATNGEGGVG